MAAPLKLGKAAFVGQIHGPTRHREMAAPLKLEIDGEDNNHHDRLAIERWRCGSLAFARVELIVIDPSSRNGGSVEACSP